MTSDPLAARVHALIASWRDPEFWKEEGGMMDCMDCAYELEAALAAALASSKEQE